MTLSGTALALFTLAGCGGTSDRGAKAEAYCHDIIQEACVRAWDCIPPGEQSADFTAHYGTSMDQCLAMPDDCANYPPTCPGFDPDAGATCLSEFTNQTCGDILMIDGKGNPTISLPSSCAAVCP